MNHDRPTAIRADDLLRHLQDLRTGTYEGVQSRGEKEDGDEEGEDASPRLAALGGPLLYVS